MMTAQWLDHGECAAYGLRVHPAYEQLKQAVQMIGGLFILFKCGRFLSEEAQGLIQNVKMLLLEAEDTIRSVQAPTSMRKHRDHMIQVIGVSRGIFQDTIFTSHWTKKDESTALFARLNEVHGMLHALSDRRMGLSMMDMNHSCACNRH